MLTVVLSAYIRLAEVGIGCEGWPSCYAQLGTGEEQRGITVLTPGGREMAHYGARVAHRYIASALGIFIVVIYLLALKQGSVRKTRVWVPTTILLITLFLSVLGYYTPTRSNPLITMGNLLGGMALLALLWWLLQREVETVKVAAFSKRRRSAALLAVLLVSVQIVLGGWSSANYASANCSGLIKCEGGILSTENLSEAFNPLRSIALDSRGQVVRETALGLMSMAHRILALLTAAYLAWLVRRLRPEPSLRGTLLALAVLSITQLLLGVLTIWLQLPLMLLTLHNAVAACLLLASVNLIHRLTPAAESLPLR